MPEAPRIKRDPRNPRLVLWAQSGHPSQIVQGVKQIKRRSCPGTGRFAFIGHNAIVLVYDTADPEDTAPASGGEEQVEAKVPQADDQNASENES